MPNISDEIEGSVAVVTGGASGIGLAAARRFADAGATVLLADRNAAALEDAAALVGPRSRTIVCDVSADDDCERLASTALELGRIGIVMANAGIALGGRFDSIPISEWTRILDVNVVGVVRTIRPFVTSLTQQGSGRIVITGSSAGLFSIEGGTNSPYATSKFALMGLARALGRQFESTGVSVHYLAPRLTDTPFPRSSVAWGRSGPRDSSQRTIDGADTVETVVEALVRGVESNRFLISLTEDTKPLLQSWAADPHP